ncbi:hypothetical protein QTP70_026770 [Hemibagrus guttatus]|uniref:Uncharacterized protein n=1 Tax=Hemibagrus guttatus TaxID=175788 RepID=A0AAE0UL29_9TELE|nr:hypothetical protein QTP70_026770 [Hemibagrus guttatus]
MKGQGGHGGLVVSMFASHLQGWGFDSRLRRVCGVCMFSPCLGSFLRSAFTELQCIVALLLPALAFGPCILTSSISDIDMKKDIEVLIAEERAQIISKYAKEEELIDF